MSRMLIKKIITLIEERIDEHEPFLADDEGYHEGYIDACRWLENKVEDMVLDYNELDEDENDQQW